MRTSWLPRSRRARNRQEIKGALVGPMEVVDHDHQRSVPGRLDECLVDLDEADRS